MVQKSILSFFGSANKSTKSASTTSLTPSQSGKTSSSKDAVEIIDSPIKQSKKTRARIIESDSEEEIDASLKSNKEEEKENKHIEKEEKENNQIEAEKSPFKSPQKNASPKKQTSGSPSVPKSPQVSSVPSSSSTSDVEIIDHDMEAPEAIPPIRKTARKQMKRKSSDSAEDRQKEMIKKIKSGNSPNKSPSQSKSPANSAVKKTTKPKEKQTTKSKLSFFKCTAKANKDDEKYVNKENRETEDSPEKMKEKEVLKSSPEKRKIKDAFLGEKAKIEVQSPKKQETDQESSPEKMEVYKCLNMFKKTPKVTLKRLQESPASKKSDSDIKTSPTAKKSNSDTKTDSNKASNEENNKKKASTDNSEESPKVKASSTTKKSDSDTETDSNKASKEEDNKKKASTDNSEESPKVKASPATKKSNGDTKTNSNKASKEDDKKKASKDSSEDDGSKDSSEGELDKSHNEKGGKTPTPKKKNPFENKPNASKCTYNPAKSKYHPVDDAMWKSGQNVPYIALSRTFEIIENTKGRIKTIEILSNFLRSVIALTPDNLLPCIYLCLNKVAPAFEGVELMVGDSFMMKAIAQSTGRSMERIKKDKEELGDLGIVAEQSKSNQRMMFQPAPLTVKKVFSVLKEIGLMSGTSVQTKKVDKIKSMFVACKESEARYLIRSLGGKLRIGLAEQSVLQAIAQACYLTPPGKDIMNAGAKQGAEDLKSKIDAHALVLKTTYCECPTYDRIVPIILEHGILALPDHCKLEPGIPLQPMLAHPTKGVDEVLKRFENAKFTCEYKYDGERAQIHLLESGKMKIFSRNQEDNTTKYPDILNRISESFGDSLKSFVLDSEVVAYDVKEKKILPFQILTTRKRKDVIESDIKVTVCVFPFDLLYLNGENLVQKPFQERRKLLKETFSEVEGKLMFATSMDGTDTEEIQEFLEESIKGNCEGLMVKTLDIEATYEIAKRSRNWLKLKKDYLDGVGDTIDVVPIGGYLGKGKRTGLYGGFLLACYDPDNEEYQALCKIGTGFTDENLQNFTGFLKEFVLDSPKSYYSYDTSQPPDHWFDAEKVKVWEIKCADLSISPVYKAANGLVDPEKGISLRFPRFIRIRDDKNPEQATSSQQIADMYKNQDQIKNQTTSNTNEDEFY